MKVETRAVPMSGWSWARIMVPEGEPFQTWPDGEGDVGLRVYVVPDRIRWSRTVDGELRVTADFAVVGGKVLCTDVRHHGSPERPVSTTAIRDVALEEVAREALLAHAMEERGGFAPGDPDEARLTRPGDDSASFFATHTAPLDAVARRSVDRELKGTRGRPPISREELEQAAAIYRSAAARPTQAVAEAMGLSARQATSRVQAARRAGLLPPTTPGKVTR